MAVPRHALKIFLSNRFSYAQIINDVGHVVVSANSTGTEKKELTSRSDKLAASAVGTELAKKAQEKGIDAVQWTRDSRGRAKQRYHGKVAALVDALQAGGVALQGSK